MLRDDSAAHLPLSGSAPLARRRNRSKLRYLPKSDGRAKGSCRQMPRFPDLPSSSLARLPGRGRFRRCLPLESAFSWESAERSLSPNLHQSTPFALVWEQRRRGDSVLRHFEGDAAGERLHGRFACAVGNLFGEDLLLPDFLQKCTMVVGFQVEQTPFSERRLKALPKSAGQKTALQKRAFAALLSHTVIVLFCRKAASFCRQGVESGRISNQNG